MENAQLLSILNGINEAIYISDPLTHEMLYANQALVNSFGRFSGKKCYEYLHNKDVPCSFCSNAKIFGNNAQSSYAWEFKNKKNGRWYRCIDRAIKWPDGRMVRCEIAVDIDDMKKNEEELDQYRNQLNELVIERTKRIHMLAELSMQTFDEPEAIFNNIIKKLADTFGVRLVYLSEIRETKVNFINLYADGELIIDAGSCELKVTPCYRVSESKEIELFADVQERFPEAEFLKVYNVSSCCGIPCMDSNGKVLAVLCILDENPMHYSEEDGDIIRIIGQRIGKELERNKSEERLRKSEERYALIIEGASDGIWDRDLVTGDSYFSTRWKQMLGYKDEEFPNEVDRLYGIIHPDDLERVKGAINDHLYGETPHYLCEFRIRHKDGSYRWVMARGAAMWDVAGKPVRFSGSHTDITERKLMEEEFLKGQRLESIGVLAGGIAHDFNNILTGVLTNLEVAKDCLLEQGNEDENVIKSLNYAESAAIRAVDLTRQLLTFSKGGAPVVKTVSVSELLVETASFVLRGSNVKKRCFIPDDLWNAKIDGNQISQVINNLVINAQQAMPDGGTVIIRAENSYIENGSLPPLKAGKYIKLTIKDRGCGIPEEDLIKIFDPYFTTKSKGSGLGLTTSYTIVKRHMGHMIVESELGLGTWFQVYLPASEEARVDREGGTAKDCRGFGRVLLLEDEDIVAKSVNIIASSAGYELEHAKDGKEAVNLYKSAMKSGNSFDVVMMDLTIPGGMGGVETIKRLKRIDPFIKAIVCSGYSDDAVMANYGEHGFCDVLPKPFTKDQVLEKLADVIRGPA